MVKLRELLTDKQFQYWPVSSIALYALRNNILPLSLNTWYKYVNKFGLAKVKPPSRSKQREISVRAERPHQIWHADITQFVTGDNVRHYVYLVVGNFCRKIRKNVTPHGPGVTLITDGGPENNLKDFLAAPGQTIEHRIALVDVHYSNSMIEAHNKIVKYNDLYRMNISDGEHLRKIFPSIVENFNNRPHVSLDGLTPSEAEQSLLLNREQLRIYTAEATGERKKYNRINQCSHCKD